MNGKKERSQRPLYELFNRVPRRYDLLNRLFTWRLDQRWRRLAAAQCLRPGARSVVDLCCGTGDLGQIMAKQAGPEVSLAGVDFSERMLAVAQEKSSRLAGGHRLSLARADAAQLPFADGSLDSVGIAFAFRNLTYRNPRREEYLSEIGRVIKPGGICVIVESSQPTWMPLRFCYHLYLRLVVERLGSLLSDARAYSYLAKSAREFYRAEELSSLIVSAGFQKVEFRRLLGGVAAIHVAVK
jgi:demethylmenaquinone methyltransferase/2-methoxy-6-polyprenyl-1,4-benzoquinol methylase